MASSMLQELPLTSGPLDLKALEEKVVRTIEVLNKTRAAKAKADEEIDNLKLEVMDRDDQIATMQKDLIALRKDREEARGRVERMITQIDGLIASESEV
jgi:septation ring formation regulator EzrA